MRMVYLTLKAAARYWTTHVYKDANKRKNTALVFICNDSSNWRIHENHKTKMQGWNFFKLKGPIIKTKTKL